MVIRSTISGTPFIVVSHSEIGKGKEENQDSLLVYTEIHKIIVIVCDGLGSAPFSREGAKKACNIALAHLKQDIISEEIISKIYESWIALLDGNPNLYDTTLKFIRIDDKEIVYGGVGDGMIAIHSSQNCEQFTPAHSFSNQTDSLMSFDLSKVFWLKRMPISKFCSGLISTDGFSEDFNSDKLTEFMAESVKEIQINAEKYNQDLIATLANWPVETNRDDKTVALIVKGDSSHE